MRNKKELPKDVQLVRGFFGWARTKLSKEGPQNPKTDLTNKSSLERGSERIAGAAQAEVSANLGSDLKLRLAVSVQFEASSLAEKLGLSKDDPVIQELAEKTTKSVDTQLPDNTQYVENPDLLANPQIKINANNQGRKVNDRSDGLVTGI